MPKIGNVEVSDDVVNALARGNPAPRPGLGAVLGAATQGAYAQVRYGLPYALEKQLGTANASDEQFYQTGLKAGDAAQALAPAASVADLTSGRVGIGRFIGENLAASAPQTLSTLGGSIAGGLIGGVPGALAGAVAVGTPQFVGSNVDRAVQEHGTLTDADASRALLVAPVQAASDALVERFLPGAEKLLGGFAAHQTGNFLTRTAKSIVKAGATEAVTEAGQQLGERYSAGLPVTGTDAAAEYVNAAVTAFAVGGTLGVAGGFRRHPADSKAPVDVTNEDVTDKINAALGLPSPETGPGSGQLALPAPDPSQPTVQQRADIVVDRRGNAAPVGPDGQVAAESRALATPSGDVVVDSQGNAAVGPTADADLLAANNIDDGSAARRDFLAGLAARGQAPQAGLDITADRVRELFANREALVPPGTATFDPTAPVDPNTSATSARALGAVDATVAPVTVPEGRTLTAEPLADLQTAIKAKDASPALKQHAQDEIAARSAEAAGDAPLTGDFQTRLTDVKDGLRGSFVQKLEATDSTDLVTKVYDRVFVDQDTASNVSKLAQRLGLLDGDLNPTPKADAIEATRTAANQAESVPAAAVAPVGTPVGAAPVVAPEAAPAAAVAPAAPTAVSLAPATVDPAFAPEFQKLKQGLRQTDDGIDLKAVPANAEQFRATVFRALADDKSDAAVSQTEKLAQKLGLISNDDARDITPLGRKTYFATPEGAADVAQAARQQGFATEAQSAAFQQGVREEISGQQGVAHTTVEELTASEAGKVFARDYVQNGATKTTPQSQAIQSRLAARTTGTAAARTTGTAAAREDVKTTTLTPGQITQRAQNRVLDAANLGAVNDGDVAALRRLVRDGATDEQFAQALQQVQGGKTLFTQPESRPSALPNAPTRGQPIFKEINTPAETTTSKVQTRTESEGAVQTYALRQLIDFAKREGGITDKRADNLHRMLDEGKTQAVKTNLREFIGDGDGKASIGRFVGPGGVLGEADAAFEQAITGKSFEQVAQHMVDNAPSPANKAVMQKVLDLAKRIASVGGHTFDVQIVKPGDNVPTALLNPDVRAYAEISQNPATSTIYLKSGESGPENGVNYQLAAHEMIHAVTLQAITYAERTDPDGKTPLGKAVKDLRTLADTVRRHLNDRLDNGDRLSMTDFELTAALGEHNAFADPHELIAWGLTNPAFQSYLQGIEVKPKETVFSKFVGLVRNVLGLTGQKYDTALTELLRVSEQVLGTSARDLAPAFARGNPAYGESGILRANASAAGVDAANRTVDKANDAVKSVAGFTERVVDTINPDNLRSKFRSTALGWLSRNQIDRLYGARVPGLLKLSDAFRARDAISGRVSTIGNSVVQAYDRLINTNKEQGQRVSALANLATQFRLDPDKAFDDHAHLKDDPNIAALRRLHAEAVKLKNDLSRGDGVGIKVFNDLRAANEFQNIAQLSGSLYSLIATDRELSLGVAGADLNPIQNFNAQPGLTTPQEARDHFAAALNQQLAAAKAFIDRKKGEVAGGSEADIRGAQQHLNPLQEKISEIYNALAKAGEAPYFHLGRFGDNFGSAQITTNADGTVVAASQRAVAEALEKGNFGIAEISADNTRPRFSLRFETVDQTNAFAELVKKLEADGHITPDTLKYGPRTRADNYGVGNVLPDFIRRAEANIDANPTYTPDENATPQDRAEMAKARENAKQAIRDVWLENQGDNSISKVLTARHTAPGFSADFIRSFSHRFDVGSGHLASIGTQPDFDAAYGDIRAQTLASLSASNDDDANVLTAVQTEVKRRQSGNVINENATTFDKARALGHAYFLGFSPAYGLVNLTQIGVVAIPELAKANGYMKSFHAIRRATPIALKLLNAAREEAFAQGPKHAADVVLTESVIQKAGVTPTQAEFLRKIIASGTVDIGSAARALGQISQGRGDSKLDIGLKYASAIGLYTETFSRLATSLAAHDLHNGDVDSSVKYATKTVSNSLFDYQNWNTARQLGKQGFAGPVTPLLTQFMSYSVQITEKLYSEALDAFAKQRIGESDASAAQRRSESRTFLMGHLTAITALAGTLGLPFASVAAAVVEKLVNAAKPGDEPYDATASYRNFLASIFGKDVAEVISRGLPRAIGLDVSQRAGEADLLPFSQLIGDRRSWRESVQATLGRSAGATPDALLSILDGGGQFANGDFTGGAISVLPVAFKNLAKTYQMTTEGYVDTQGRKLPLTPTASAFLVQLLGFTPSEKAEYSEARGDQQSRRLGLTAQAGTLRQRIVGAMSSGDTETARTLIARALEFDKANPSFAVIPSLSGALQRQQQAQQQARALRAPIGVGVNDIAGQGLTGYANVNYQ